ncbi:hypothetical protein FNJ62_21770 [Streptomyces benahoarensis]|uniref:Uncharacterized protein n=1 Tax=Streptomyces benahoarensis TaxID=2595054 RepID=A0A553Z9L7_9ACTN|nr:hypothetical protein [Streptomyces benahoarensis]TSB19893.1 hypothetical protein FNJ62_21770 [Streptomyces benahoarensis]TSB38138.1 hypothetical protein FNZ23_17535 [Streptomyces benahoarensis]
MNGTGSVPLPGAPLMDTKQGRFGLFRQEIGGRWELRPVAGGDTWTVAPSDTRPATYMERLNADNARANARSRGELL